MDIERIWPDWKRDLLSGLWQMAIVAALGWWLIDCAIDAITVP